MLSRKKTAYLGAIAFCVMIVFLCVGFAACKDDKDDIAFTVEDTLAEGNGQTAKVILLAGQSNASGCSLNAYLENNLSGEEYAELKNGYDNVYINVFSSGNNVSNGFVRSSTSQGETAAHFGPEVGLAEKLHKERPNELFFIIKFAWGGTNLFEQWLSPSSEGKTGYLYKNFIRYTKESMNYLTSKGYAPIIEGLCWMQGESDSFSEQNATEYEAHLQHFIADVRKDLASYGSKDGIAFVDACIAANPVYWVYCDGVNASKIAVAESSSNNVLIDTNALGLTCNQEPEGTPDMAHYDSLSQLKLGETFAEEIIPFFD